MNDLLENHLKMVLYVLMKNMLLNILLPISIVLAAFLIRDGIIYDTKIKMRVSESCTNELVIRDIYKESLFKACVDAGGFKKIQEAVNVSKERK